jgi:UvrB/uvrC motif
MRRIMMTPQGSHSGAAGIPMNSDISALLGDWAFNPGAVQARLVEADDGRMVLQIRVDLGLLQLEANGRPDGTRPHGFPTYLDYLREKADRAERAERPFLLDDDQCDEADREFVQFYHRRVGWLALREFAKAIADADHTLAFMDFVRNHSPNEQYTLAHEQYRGFVVFHRTQAAAALAVHEDKPEAAIDAIRDGLERLRKFFAAHGLEEQFEEDGMVKQLRSLEQSLRTLHGIEATLHEQLEQAVANEEYEAAARIRDALRKRS